MYGYLRLEGSHPSWIFSRARFSGSSLFDLEALAQINLEIKSCNSLIFSSFFLVCLLSSGGSSADWIHTRSHSFRHRAEFYHSRYLQSVGTDLIQEITVMG